MLGNTSWSCTSFRPVFQFTPSQGLPIALTQYAPGKEVWVDGRLWYSGAIYSPIRQEREVAWENRKFYYECNICHYATTVPIGEGAIGEKRDCNACGTANSLGPGQIWMRPPGFAHPISLEEGTSIDDQPERSYATRAKLRAPTPVESEMWTTLNSHMRVCPMRQHLLVTNRGPRNEGYTYCLRCGLIEPTSMHTSRVIPPHNKPYPDEREEECIGHRAARGIVLGTDFISDVLLISLRVENPISLQPGLLATDISLRTISEAIVKAACIMLDFDSGDLQAEYRPSLTEYGQRGIEAEIFLYDTLPGGAGFSRRVGELGLEVFENALNILENCQDNCDRSCYRCLRSYKNKFEHDLLDRHLGASLLRFLLYGEKPSISIERLEKSTDILYQDLLRYNTEQLEFKRNEPLDIPGIGTIVAPILAARNIKDKYVIALHLPLTPDFPPNEELREIKEFSVTTPLLLVDELVVRRNLPRASSDLFAKF